MTQRQAIAELQCHIESCDSRMLYYEENVLGHNTDAVTVYKQALEIAVDAIKESIEQKSIDSKSYCEWKICNGAVQPYYETSCGMIYGMFRGENDKYCTRCGKEIKKI